MSKTIPVLPKKTLEKVNLCIKMQVQNGKVHTIARLINMLHWNILLKKNNGIIHFDLAVILP